VLVRIAAAAVAAVVFAAAPLAAEERAAPMQPSPIWDELKRDVVGEAEIRDGAGLYTLEAPFRAHDAATVPVRFTQAPGAPDVARMTLVVDANPAPVAAEFAFGPAMRPVDLETRVRVDAYTNVRAVVETVEGDIYMAGGFVRAAGGCSAPAAKDATAAMAALGQMKARWFGEAPQAGARREAQVMLRHPNYSGLQRDQVTHLYIPAHFVDTLEVRQGEELLFSMTGGISISEDPTFRFGYADHGGELAVRATDTAGAVFEGRFPVGM
jgi:sulfur-oxidizing protein SoxY